MALFAERFAVAVLDGSGLFTAFCIRAYILIFMYTPKREKKLSTSACVQPLMQVMDMRLRGQLRNVQQLGDFLIQQSLAQENGNASFRVRQMRPSGIHLA